LLFSFLLVVALSTCGSIGDDALEKAKKIHQEHPMVDGHNDLSWVYHLSYNNTVLAMDISKPQPQIMTDIPRLRSGGVGGQFWSVYSACSMQGKDAVRVTMEQLDVVKKFVRRYPETFAFVTSTKELKTAFQAKKIASLVGIEGGHSIDTSLGALRMFYDLGGRYMTLTHTCNTPWADSAANGCANDVDCRNGTCDVISGVCTAPQSIGLTPFGEKVIREMNRLGMFIDISHVSDHTMRRVLALSKAPVIFSHSSAHSLCDHIRNVPDDVLLMLQENGGVIMVAFVPDFIRCNDKLGKLSDVADHIDYIVSGKCPDWKPDCNPGNRFPGIGAAHVGYGSDFDGIPTTIDGLDNVSHFVDLTAELIRRGYSETDVVGIIGGNVIRALETAERVSEAMSADFPAEDMVYPKRDCRS